ncbi:MAG: 2-oxo acid dehydrogenase subunit E2 [Caldilineaceae bacterium]|nr:2-oxo acid dehydrogenase subunit E2 [Caldilineaceae bacterium]
MPTPVRMPQLGESVVEGTVARWLKAPGDTVAKHEPLLEITTDKIDTEVPAPAAGVLLEIMVAEGATVAAGATLAVIGAPGESLSAVTPQAGAGDASPQPAAAMRPAQDDSTRPSRQRPGGRSFISPVVARMAAEHNLDLAAIEGTGLGGRVTKKDVEAVLERQAGTLAPPETRAPVAAEVRGELGEDDVLAPLTAIRRAIAQHMVKSKQVSPHVTTIFEVDMTAVVRHREENKQPFAQKGIALTYTPYFVMAVAAALKAVPEANSSFHDNGILLHQRIHIGIAVALATGLIVPVIRDADERNLQGLARATNDLAARARNGQLRPDEVKGGTFTITNHGTGGSLVATPIINQPQSAILGVGAITKRPVVRSSRASLLPSADDAIIIRPMCYLSLSFDHRVMDGAQADAFLTVVKEKLENWEQ